MSVPNTRSQAPYRQALIDLKDAIITRPWFLWAQGVDTAIANIASAAGTGNVTAPATLTSDELVIGQGTENIAALGSLGTTTTVLHGNAGGPPTFGQVNLATDVTGDLPYANLAQGSALSVLGVTGNATADNASIVAAADHQVLRRSGTGVSFGAIDLTSSSAVNGVLPVANGGTLPPAVVILTDAQIKALPTTPITIIAATASGFQNRVLAATFRINTVAGAYTNVTPATGNLRLETPSGIFVVVAAANQTSFTIPLTRLTDFLTVTANQLVNANPYAEAVQESTQGDWGWLLPSISPTSGVDASAVQVALSNAAGNLTGGNAGNTLKITVYYAVEAT